MMNRSLLLIQLLNLNLQISPWSTTTWSLEKRDPAKTAAHLALLAKQSVGISNPGQGTSSASCFHSLHTRTTFWRSSGLRNLNTLLRISLGRLAIFVLSRSWVPTVSSFLVFTQETLNLDETGSSGHLDLRMFWFLQECIRSMAAAFWAAWCSQDCRLLFLLCTKRTKKVNKNYKKNTPCTCRFIRFG